MIDLKKTFGHVVRVTREEPHEPTNMNAYYQIVGKYGTIYGWDDATVEMYVKSMVKANRLERSGKYKAKNHYDDATAFIVPIDHIKDAFKVIKARKRRHLSPEARKVATERLARMRSSKKIHTPNAQEGGQNG